VRVSPRTTRRGGVDAGRPAFAALAIVCGLWLSWAGGAPAQSPAPSGQDVAERDRGRPAAAPRPRLRVEVRRRRDRDEGDDPDGLFVERVVGIEGDVVRTTARAVIVYGIPLATAGVRLPGPVLRFPAVPAGSVPVLGDNRPGSCDSTQWPDPFVPASYIHHPARLRPRRPRRRGGRHPGGTEDAARAPALARCRLRRPADPLPAPRARQGLPRGARPPGRAAAPGAPPPRPSRRCRRRDRGVLGHRGGDPVRGITG
jgi:hypothetical protein